MFSERRPQMIKKYLLLLASGCLVAAFPASADCVKCDNFQACVPDVTATGCSCNIRVRSGTTICREQGICDGSPNSCSGDPGTLIAEAPGIVIEAAALNQLTDREPLLAVLIFGSLKADSKGIVRLLNVEPYDGGTLRTADGEVFSHRASFSSRASGEVAFRFMLTNMSSGEKIQYVGTISNRGQNINFSKVVTDNQGTSHRVSEDWHFEPK